MMDLKEQRDKDFLRAVRQAMRDHRGPMNLRQIVAEVAAGPAPYYYVTYDHAVNTLSESRKLQTAIGAPTRRGAMWREILQRVNDLCKQQGITRRRALSMVLNHGEASSFFLEPASAWVLYHNIVQPRRRRPPRRNSE
ncbi:MAG: hypothetical protein J1E63_08225 [Muribaculaceae bacterium]|nr:hypothetical protein [Muribaculaceae bacterium]